MLFKSYQDAHQRLNLSGSYQLEINGSNKDGISSLKLTDHIDSYNRYTHAGRIIYYVGEGRTKSPGHPAGNQMENKQEPFRRSWGLQNRFPLLHKRYDGSVILLGYYRVSDMRKRMGHEGFTYFEFELRQETYTQYLTPVLDIPLIPSSLPTSSVASTATASVTSATSARGNLGCHRCNIIKNLFDLSPVKRVSLGGV